MKGSFRVGDLILDPGKCIVCLVLKVPGSDFARYEGLWLINDYCPSNAGHVDAVFFPSMWNKINK